MFSKGLSPQKRKMHDEYHDPDYIRLHSNPCKKIRDEFGGNNHKESNMNISTKLKYVVDIISREIKREISLHVSLLSEIDERIYLARSLLHRLRFVIVKEYYRKQELSICEMDALAIRGNSSLFEEGALGLQMEIHPALKYMFTPSDKVYSKVPECIEDINTIRTRFQLQRRHAGRFKQPVRTKGVIDNSQECNEQFIEETDVVDPTEMRYRKSTTSRRGAQNITPESTTNIPPLVKSTKTLNTIRLNNKIKHIIVVGNTSTYIGQNNDAGRELRKPGYNCLTHKWLVYVQSKESKTSLQTFVKKVRFYLHPSYRPNDIVDIRKPPFQISRRGWGEFPMRIQLYFNDNLKQKPVQVVHNVVLDRTLSGIHTLGAETLMEIWLRPEPFFKEKEISHLLTANTMEPAYRKDKSVINYETESVQTSISRTAKKKEELNSDSCGFVYKRDYDASENTEIDLSGLVNESISNKSSLGIETHRLFMKTKQETSVNSKHEYIKNCIQSDSTESTDASLGPTTILSYNKLWQIESSVLPNSNFENVAAKPKQLELEDHNFVLKNSNSIKFTSPMVIKLKTVKSLNSENGANSKNNNNIIALSQVAKLMPIKANDFTQMNKPTASYAPVSTAVENTTKNAILQKQLVKLVDGEGKIKFMQVLMATPQSQTQNEVEIRRNDINTSLRRVVTTPTKPANNCTNAVTEHVGLKQLIRNASNKPQSTSYKETLNNPTIAVGSPKQIVFQKEGKLFIIDPLQMRLKQERKKQISLLKPQTTSQCQTLKTTIQSKALRNMMSDHDYTSLIVNPTAKKKNLEVSDLRSDLRLIGSNDNIGVEFLQQLRIQFEEDFLDQNFPDMRSAIDYILRRLPLIESKNSISYFSAVSPIVKDFGALPVMKQRSYEWLRAKYVSRFVRNHKYLQELNLSKKESFWSTREILVYARYHAFTPKMKLFDVTSFKLETLLQSPSACAIIHTLTSANPSNLEEGNNLQQRPVFSQYLRNKVTLEQNYYHFDSLTPNRRIKLWLKSESLKSVREPCVEYADEPINIFSIPSMIVTGTKDCKNNCAPYSSSNQPYNYRQQQYPLIPEYLSESYILVSDICRDLNIKLPPEIVESDMIFPLAHTIIAQCLYLFVEKLIRRTIALKQNASVADGLNLTAHDIGKVLFRNAEFDFLTNKNFGTYSE